MNILPRDKQIAVIGALAEGCSIRATERLTGVHRDTIMRLSVRVGQQCDTLHDRVFRNLSPHHVELDEIWAFVGMKQKQARQQRDKSKGDQYLFLALDPTSKAFLSYKVGKRDANTTTELVYDLRERVINRPHISSDAFQPYTQVITDIFGDECQYGQVIKRYSNPPLDTVARRYSPGAVVAVNRRHVIGHQPHICTSRIERANLSIRMGSRRFTRLTNGFSKKLENHKAAISLFVAHYNLCREHETVRSTPAMALGLTDHTWTIGELIANTLDNPLFPNEGRRYGRFTVIDGGGAD